MSIEELVSGPAYDTSTCPDMSNRFWRKGQSEEVIQGCQGDTPFESANVCLYSCSGDCKEIDGGYICEDWQSENDFECGLHPQAANQLSDVCENINASWLRDDPVKLNERVNSIKEEACGCVKSLDDI